jgi:alanine racemase
LGNGAGFVTIKDKKAKILGVCMDMLMVDVTEIDCTGDSVIFLAKAQLFRKWQKLNTIPYEVLTSISQRVKRVFIDKIVFRAGVTFRIYILDNSK